MNDDKKSTIQKICDDLSKLLQEKNDAYGSSFERCPEFLRILFPNGIPTEKYGDVLLLARIFDKMMRIANQKNAFDEDPFMDLAGYGILGCKRNIENRGQEFLPEVQEINECRHDWNQDQDRKERVFLCFGKWTYGANNDFLSLKLYNSEGLEKLIEEATIQEDEERLALLQIVQHMILEIYRKEASALKANLNLAFRMKFDEKWLFGSDYDLNNEEDLRDAVDDLSRLWVNLRNF